jgi:monofunctional biosynthetic peptidoglycan transglycosylase
MPLDSISPALVKAVIAAEDDGFYVHPGFDLVAILNAYQYNREKNSLRHGASTLTQQMAKNLFVGGEREFSRKYAELFYAVLMEALLGKERILELYMNYAQWGPALFGCEAAAQHYFKKSCTVLSVDQAARLAAVLAKPMTLNPHFTQSPLLDKRIRVIGDNLYRRHLIDDSLYIHLTATDSMIRVMELKEGDTSNRSSSGGDSNGKKEKSRLHF